MRNRLELPYLIKIVHHIGFVFLIAAYLLLVTIVFFKCFEEVEEKKRVVEKRN